MSTIFMHVGQAGNQLAMDYWKLLLLESGSIEEDIFFDRNRCCARGILIDSEPKVINRIDKDLVLSSIFPE
jgi:hypothetical protein